MDGYTIIYKKLVCNEENLFVSNNNNVEHIYNGTPAIIMYRRITYIYPI